MEIDAIKTVRRWMTVLMLMTLPAALTLLRDAKADSRILGTARIDPTTTGWQLVFKVAGDAARLTTTKSSRLPLTLRPGAIRSATVKPGGLCILPLTDRDLASFLPGEASFIVHAPGWIDLPCRFSTEPLFTAEPDVAQVAVMRCATIMKPDSLVPVVTVPGFQPLRFETRQPVVLSAGGETTHVLRPGARGRAIYLLFPTGAMAAEGLALITCTDGYRITNRIAVPASTPAGRWSVSQFDLGESRTVESVQVTAVSGAPISWSGAILWGPLRSGSAAALSPRALRMIDGEPITLFSFNSPSLAGWEIRGSGWGTTDTVGEFFQRKGESRYFADSKANGGEPATGTILSPKFEITGSRLAFLANGHGVLNYFALVDAVDEKELIRSPVPEKTGPFERISWDVSKWRGKTVRFKAVDGDNRAAYAWLAFDAIVVEP